MKVHPVGAKLFHADSWTEMMKLIVTFHNFSNAPKNLSINSRVHKLIQYGGKQGNFGPEGMLKVI